MFTTNDCIKKHYAVLFYLLFAIFIIIAISQKQYFFIDDHAAYGFANAPTGTFQSMVEKKAVVHTIGDAAPVSNNVKYTPASEFYAKLTSVSQDRRFDYKNMCESIKYEAAPPLPTVLLHTICSFFPGVFSIWFAGILNLIFSLLLLYVSRKLLYLLLEDQRTVDILSLVLVCSAAIITANAFFRMYIMAMFASTLESYLLLKQVGKPITKKFCLQLFAVTLFGAHIHHYCTLFAVFMSIIFGIMLLVDRDFKGFGNFCFAQIAAGIVACAIFPPMLFTIIKFFGAKSATVFEAWAVRPLMPYHEVVLEYIWMINCKLFGGLLLIIFPAMLFFAIYNLRHEERIQPNIARRRYVMLLASVVAYILIICARDSIVIGWEADGLGHNFRYFQPVWALIIIGCLAYFSANAKKYFKPQFVKYCIPALAILITLGGWYFADINGRYIYYAYTKYENVRKPYYDADAICLTSDAITFEVSYELRPYKSLTWIKIPKFNPAQLEDFKKEDKLVVCIQLSDAVADKVFLELMKFLPMFEAKAKHPLFANLVPEFECPGNIYFLDRRVGQ